MYKLSRLLWLRLYGQLVRTDPLLSDGVMRHGLGEILATCRQITTCDLRLRSCVREDQQDLA